MHRKQYAGLTAGEVVSRQQAGLVNRADSDASRSLADILRGNVLTPFNALITALAVVVLVGLWYNKRRELLRKISESRENRLV